jgi:hypothetical protein
MPSPAQGVATTATGATPPSPAASSTVHLLPSSTLTPTDTETPFPQLSTSTPAPVVSGTAEEGPIIHYFRANVEEAAPVDRIVLQWQTEGATEAVLYHIPPSGHLPSSGWHVAPSGSYTYTIEPGETNWSDFLLYAMSGTERSTSANLRLKLRCAALWFFAPAPAVCPTAPIVSAAAEEHFEHGTMIWVKEPWSPWESAEGWIIVLYDDWNDWSLYKDQWQEGQPDRDTELSPPSGLYQPIRGFGLLWRQNPDVRDQLGWAKDQETGFQATIQHTTQYKYNSIYVRALDGNVWHLGPEFSSWAKIVIDKK